MKAFKNNSMMSAIEANVTWLPAFQELVSNFNKLPLKNISDPTELVELIVDLDGLMVKKFPDKEAKLFGTPISPAKALGMLDLQVNELRVSPANREGMLKAASMLSGICTITDSGLEMDKKRYKAYVEQHCYRHLDKGQAELYKEYEELIEQIRTFADKYQLDARHGLFDFDRMSGGDIRISEVCFNQLASRLPK